MQNRSKRAGGVLRWAYCALLVALASGSAQAQSSPDIEQGRLSLHWGDPAPVARGRAQMAPRLRAQLTTDDGRRIPMEAGLARRAAADLPALANRRVAVSFKRLPVAGQRRLQRVPEVIVPIDAATLTTPRSGSAGQVMAAASVLGTTRWVTLMCRFSDIASEQKDKTFFNNQYGAAVGQLGHYWSEVSYGKINLTGSSAEGWFALPNPRATYVTTGTDGEDDADLDRLFQDCVAAADPTVNFNGVQGINMMFNGELDGFAWGGGSCATFEGARRCTSVTWNPPWSFSNLAPLAHEMGHGYGLPHSDNSDGDDDTYDNPWDVMSDGWYNATTSATYGTLPKHIAMIQRDRLGWVAAARKLELSYGAGGSRQVELQFASLAGATGVQMIVLPLQAQPDPAQTVRYTLEARRPIGTYEGNLAGTAVIIHRLFDGTAYSQDTSVPPGDRANNEGSMFKVGESWSAPGGAYLLRVDAATANGFLLTLTSAQLGQVTGGNLPARRLSATATRAASAPASTSDYRRAPATRRPPIRARLR
ncbi:hypothetical protein [Pseudoxanthomonas indica]|uniref:M6 family metalloprotease domain-containing protein n=1 Tax=Pseudoxanthomonas indica TaxID=428993 RepID=A0A1T5LA64_9GAMM|nr:hypothetical protein [Pseudoxanthomonas indica]GGD32656.1 hypothetical protein GCM10007235_00640 [Pseudoxanthomonas indica]SKC72872.1 M6 family metalloprotease domain-containing protein [Pseudoxanthomonas indica]